MGKQIAIQPPPSLSRLLSNLEAANSHPKLAYDHIAALQIDVEHVVRKLDLIEDYFVGQCPEDLDEETWKDDIANDIESFL